eukprot:TRINITY_DN11102_c0_g6_i1.p2 TRINITY_DN11102_c0_g6~~TRINITY_DN11102_c0_g6_i1.p2  ORF type:complete len:117 (-),score=20.57 TRINITY_DN11102_c0_g6_i1:71-421(-)
MQKRHCNCKPDEDCSMADPEIVEIPSVEYNEARKEMREEEISWWGRRATLTRRAANRLRRRLGSLKCSVCYDDEELWIAACEHICCKECWQQWLKIKKKCPVCRCCTRINKLIAVN